MGFRRDSMKGEGNANGWNQSRQWGVLPTSLVCPVPSYSIPSTPRTELGT